MRHIKHTLARTLVVVLALCTALTMSLTCAAVNVEAGGQFVVESKINDEAQKDAAFRIWRVAEQDGKTWVEPFDKYQFALRTETESEASAMAANLATIVVRDAVKETATGTTDDQGQLTFDNLQNGIYLIVGDSRPVDGGSCQPKPTLVLIQNGEDIKVEIKHDFISNQAPPSPGVTPSIVNRRVLKVWEDDDASTRPEEITVQLLRNGRVYGTKTLNARNQWRYTWTSLPAGYNWVITEVDIPDDYMVSVDQSGITTVITNTLNEPEDPTPPPPDDPTLPHPDDPEPLEPDGPTGLEPPLPPKLPQTGTSWWLVHLLSAGGVLMIILGTLLRREMDS